MANSPQVLIIDDDPDGRVEARRSLQRAHLEVSGEVGLGTEAVSYAKEVEPDVILLAVEEPVTRALDTAESLGNVLAQTPLIFYSSLSDVESVRRAMLAGAKNYLTKPLDSTRVNQAVLRTLELEERRRMREAGQLAGVSSRGTVITVTGAKGGIGKSMIATNLALALKKAQPRRVVLVDADTSFGDDATLLDVKPALTASHVLRDIEGMDRWKIVNYVTQAPEGLELLAAPNDDGLHWDEAPPGSLQRILDLLALNYDFVVVDTAGAFDRYVKEAMDAATVVLLVTTGEVSSIRDAKGGMFRLAKWAIPPEKVKLVLNHVARSEGLKLSDLEEATGKTVFWELPHDKGVPRSVQLGEPIVLGAPNSQAARSLFALSRAIGGTAARAVVEESKAPLFAALRSWRHGS